VRPPLPLLWGKNGKALINLRKVENDDIDTLNTRSIKNSKSLLEFHTITVLKLLLSAQKRSMAISGWNRTCWLAGKDNYFLQANQPKTWRLNVWQNTWSTFFISFTFVFSYLWSNAKHTAHMCGGINTLKQNLRTSLRLAYHGHKNLAHTSKTRLVKRPKRLQLLGSRFASFLLFQTPKNWT